MTTKKDLQSQAEKLEKELEILKEKINSIDDDDKILPFDFEKDRGRGQKIGMVFGRNQLLVFDNEYDYGVYCHGMSDKTKMKLGKQVEIDEMKNGYWYYEIRYIGYTQIHRFYCRLYLGDGMYVYVWNDGTRIEKTEIRDTSEYYELLPVEA